MTDDYENAIHSIAERLEAANIPLRAGERADWDREARLLVDRASQDDPTRSAEQLLAYRLSGIPLAYLVGSERFLGNDFDVETGVVIPHPATELLALLALRALGRYGENTVSPKLLEVGVGVGVIAISALKRRPEIEAHASELSGASLRLTWGNAQRILDDVSNLYLYQAYAADDVFSPFAPRGLKDVSVVVSNPPYLIVGDEVSEATKKSGVAHFSYAPVPDPSWFLRQVLAAPDGLLAEDCSVLMECIDWHAEEHEGVMREAGWQTEIFDREVYIARYGAAPDMADMGRTRHRVMHAWRGSGPGLGA